MNNVIDARGMSCPEPVLMTMQVIDAGQTTFDVLVDNQVAVENITRCCHHKGFTILVTEENETFTLKVNRK